MALLVNLVWAAAGLVAVANQPHHPTSSSDNATIPAASTDNTMNTLFKLTVLVLALAAWTENKVDFFVDDQLYHTVVHNPDDDEKGWPFNQRFHLILNIAVGGNWGGKEGIDYTIWPQRLEVDWVRVYQ